MEDWIPPSAEILHTASLSRRAVDLAQDGNHQEALELLQAAITSAQKSVQIVPNSVSFAYFLCQLQAQAAQGVYEHQKVIEMCEKALCIPQPTDPLEDDPEDGNDRRFTTLTRIESVKKAIQRSIIHCNLAIQEKIKDYWGSLSVDDQRSALKVSIEDLTSFKDQRTKSIISEAIAFGVKNRNWKFWTCYSCDQKFPDSETQFNHLLEQHMLTLPPDLESVLPSKLDENWCEVIKRGRWRPVDSAAVPEHEAKWQQRYQYLGQDEERSKYLARGGPILDNWEASAADFDRQKRLTTIRQMLYDLLVNKKSLSAEHIQKVTKFSLNKLEEKNIVSSDSDLWEIELDKTHLCICLLDVPELDEIVKFLEELHQFATDNVSNKVDGTFDSNRMASQIQETIYCEGDHLCLALHDCDDPASAIKIDGEDQGPPNLSALLKWCFTDSPMEDALESWHLWS